MPRVVYSGKRLPLTLSMPWLEAPVTFGHSRDAHMPPKDAARLCAEAPADFRIVEAETEAATKTEPVAAGPQKRQQRKKRAR
jgi:hypothetical protein